MSEAAQKRLTVDISQKAHRQLKGACADRGMTMRESRPPKHQPYAGQRSKNARRVVIPNPTTAMDVTPLNITEMIVMSKKHCKKRVFDSFDVGDLASLSALPSGQAKQKCCGEYGHPTPTTIHLILLCARLLSTEPLETAENDSCVDVDSVRESAYGCLAGGTSWADRRRSSLNSSPRGFCFGEQLPV